MGQSKRKIMNWPEYNKALRQRGSITFWVDESVRNGWYNTKQSGVRGRSHRYTDIALETCLVVKGIFSLSLRATEGFLDSIFETLGVDIKAPDYSSVSKRAQTVEINYRPPSRGSAVHLVIDSTGLKVFGEGEWKTRKHGKEKR